jgi:uncharacterized protein
VGKAGKDNGVLVLHILDQRRIEIETGYGMEGILPDAKCHWITEEIAVPFFKKNSFADGHYEVIRALVRAIKQPDIKHSELVSQRVTQPGTTTDRLPTIETHDAIALKYAPIADRFLYGRWTPVVFLALGGLIFVLVTASYRSRSRGQEPYARYKLLQSGSARLQYVSTLPVAASAYFAEYSRTGTFFSVAPVLVGSLFFMYWRRRKALNALREAPRICQCGKPMRRLDETEDDAYIAKGNVAEEAIHSMDYDVWLCACGKSKIEAYKGTSFATPCPKCSYRTFRVTDTRTLRAATTMSTGLSETTHTCANCNYSKVDTHVIPMISTSSNSSGSGSSGGSSGSFGGGSSGGGGAGSSY